MRKEDEAKDDEDEGRERGGEGRETRTLPALRKYTMPHRSLLPRLLVDREIHIDDQEIRQRLVQVHRRRMLHELRVIMGARALEPTGAVGGGGGDARLERFGAVDLRFKFYAEFFLYHG